MTQAELLGRFIAGSSFHHISKEALGSLKVRVLDTLGCAIGALGAQPIEICRQQVDEFGGNPLCSLIGGGKSSPTMAAFWNTALTGYLNLTDNYLAKATTCQPADNFGSVLAAAEYANLSGQDFLTAFAVAYEVHCQLTEHAASVRSAFNYQTRLAISIAAGVSKALGLNASESANAIAIAACSQFGLANNEAQPNSIWKKLASSQSAFNATHATFLAARGITGPLKIFEGPDGVAEALEQQFDISWDKVKLQSATKTSVKSYNAEMHTQSAIYAALLLRKRHRIDPKNINHVKVETFKITNEITADGEDRERANSVLNKQSADPSMSYAIALAFLNGQVMPEQYGEQCVPRAHVQDFLRRVDVVENPFYTHLYPKKMMSKIQIELNDGSKLEETVSEYPGFSANPLNWSQIIGKFDHVADANIDGWTRDRIVDVVGDLENRSIVDLTSLLGLVEPFRRAA